MTQSLRMPAAFVGHGSPMNTLEDNRFTAAWRQLAGCVPRPRAVLSISAHWFIQGSAVTAMRQPRTIHDFYGFPQQLFDFDYPAPGEPDIAREIAEVVQPHFLGLDEDSWGLDHGTWSVLAHMFPAADVPVIQLSIHSGEALQYHIDLGARLAPLRDRGIFIVGSGNVVHNLRKVDFSRADEAFDWGQRFDGSVRQIMTSNPADLASIGNHPDYPMSVPTAEHFLPLAYLAGLCAASGEAAVPFVEGGALGSLTMTSYVVGAPQARSDAPVSGGGASMPDPRAVPPQQTNT